METIGDTQNIETLFRDQRLTVEREAPRFAAVWSAAQSRPSSRVGFKLSFVSAVLVVAVILLSIASWVTRRDARPPKNTANVIVPVSPPMKRAPKGIVADRVPDTTGSAFNRAHERRRNSRSSLPKRTVKAPMGEIGVPTVAVLKWESPTALLMQSPSDDLLVVLPHFYQSVGELETFLYETHQ